MLPNAFWRTAQKRRYHRRYFIRRRSAGCPIRSGFLCVDTNKKSHCAKTRPVRIRRFGSWKARLNEKESICALQKRTRPSPNFSCCLFGKERQETGRSGGFNRSETANNASWRGSARSDKKFFRQRRIRLRRKLSKITMDFSLTIPAFISRYSHVSCAMHIAFGAGIFGFYQRSFHKRPSRPARGQTSKTENLLEWFIFNSRFQHGVYCFGDCSRFFRSAAFWI